ncbi:DUF2637 domain-containing protein [Streptomyces sp. NPDC004959]|uniref:DUF2637 domain-containing protein n=1 Tax=unclassified Streptomyces TaxID=2593676 RepID=UPI0004CA5B52|nr:DUF2637 domain-containing protein [Streptomyces sp. NRRL F-5630]
MSDPKRSSASWWDRAVVVALGGAACALSYDSLQQMAVAVHVRGALTYAFPLVIDGFIAYGVRALLVLQDAPLRARAYLWGLFGAATATSIWANAVHAVRLNDVATATGLHLGNKVVAALSTIAPLALAGATHLYILIDRGMDRVRSAAQKVSFDRRPPEPVTDARSVLDQAPEVSAAEVDGHKHREALVAGRVSEPVEEQTAVAVHDAVISEVEDSSRSERPVGSPDGGQPVLPGLSATNTGRTAGVPTGTDAGLRLVKGTGTADTPQGPSTAEDSPRTAPTRTTPRTAAAVRPRQRPGEDADHTERLLQIAREAVRVEGRLTRKVVADAIRGRDLTLSNDRLTELVHALKDQPGQSRSGHRPG